LLQNTQNIN